MLAGAALQGANVKSALLLFAYAAGAAASLAIVLLTGNRLFSALKGSLGASEWLRRGLGVLVLAAVAAIAFGLDTGFLTRISAPPPPPWSSACWIGSSRRRRPRPDRR